MDALRAPPRPDAADLALRERAGRIYQTHLDRWMLAASHEPALAHHLSLQRGMAFAFLDELAPLYGVRSWTPDEFERAFLRGALAAWRPGTVLRATRDGWQTNGSMCPLGALTEIDFDACRQCRSFVDAVTRAALQDRASHVSFRSLLAAGEGSCESAIHLRRRTGGHADDTLADTGS